MITNTELHEREMRLLNKLYGNGAGEELQKGMADLRLDSTDISIERAMGGVLVRSGLDAKTQELVVIASCATLGHTVPQSGAHAQAALDIGATREETIEVVLQLLFYAGGAAVRNALVNIRDVINVELNVEAKTS